ncbi:MAG TPA: phospholipase D-like domain-containing protein [Bacteroidia bacterium]|jgi:hypothetical protein|nr:phospholipase D-like domain-containing protein [Bacteroidia bacterium]
MKRKKTFSALLLFNLTVFCFVARSQNPKIKCYFNHPVNTNVSSGVNAVYLNSTFDDTVAAYINRAKYTIDIAQYDYLSTGSSGVNIIAVAINNAYARGVVIRWIYNGSSGNTGLGLINSNIKKLASPTTSAYGIMHNKFMVIDVNSSNANDAFLWTGSYDWSDQQTVGDYNNMVIIQDQNVAMTYYNQFNQMWGGSGPSPNSANSKFGVYKSPSAVTSFTVAGTPVQVYFSPMDNSQNHILSTINSTNNEMFFGIYTFTDNTIANTIKNKYNAGNAVHGIMDQYSTTFAAYSTLNPVLGTNLKVYTSSNTYHNKIMLVDFLHPASDPQVFTGSFNWTASAENNNDEGSVVIHDSVIVNQYYQSLCKNFTDMGGTACPAINGIEAYDYGQMQCAVYPNPFSDEITVDVKNSGEKLTIRITDPLGKTVLEKEGYYTNRMKINTSALSHGIYFVRVFDGSNSFIQKIIK